MNSFQCSIPSCDNVYDGDTIKDVRLSIGIPTLDVGFWIQRDIRINGIDTPESRPRRSGRTFESIMREKRAAVLARLAVVELLKDNDFRFEALNVKLGKYAGRVVATVIVDGVNLAQHLIGLGHAKPYDGRGPRPEWGF